MALLKVCQVQWDMSIQSRVSTLAQRYLYFWYSQTFILFIFYFILILPAFLDTGLPRGNRHERDTQVPSKVPSLPNPTTREGWPHHRGLRPPLFSINESAVRRDLDRSKFPTRHNQSEVLPRSGFLRRRFARKPVVTSRNVGYFLKLQKFRTEIY